MNAFRLKFGGADDQAIRVCSTLDQTWKLAPKTDEQIQFGRDDLVNLKNVSEHRVLLRIQRTLHEDGDIIVRSSRRAAFSLCDVGDKLWFQPGEVLNIRSINARDPMTEGRKEVA